MAVIPTAIGVTLYDCLSLTNQEISKDQALLSLNIGITSTQLSCTKVNMVESLFNIL